MPQPFKTLTGMARVSEPWERIFLLVMLLTLAVASLQTWLGIPRLIGGFVVLILLVEVAASFFILDLVRTRLDRGG